MLNWKKWKENDRVEMWDEIVVNQKNNIDKDPNELVAWKKERKLKIQNDTFKNWILYEDDNRIFLNKPAWIVIHEWNKHDKDLVLNDYLESYLKNKINDVFKPSFWFRLDKDTSWIIVAWKNYESLKYLNEIIRERKTEKKYLCIVRWVFPKKILIDYPLFKWFNSKFWRAQSFVNTEKWVKAITEAKLEKTINLNHIWDVSLVRLKLLTWRMHQIRAHLSFIDFPILWDMMYWDWKLNRQLYTYYNIDRQLLHSREYWFYDKFTKKILNIKTYIPDDFNIIK